MPIFSMKVNVTTGSSAGTYKTMLGLKMANTLGNIARLRKLIVGGAGEAAADVNISVKLDRTNNLADGTSTSFNVANIFKNDPKSVASMVNAIGSTYTVEPTTYDGAVGNLGSFNSRGTIVIEWQRLEGPLWGINQTLGILLAPGAASATKVDLGVEWEE